METKNKKKISSLIKAILAGGIVGTITNVSPGKIIACSVIFGTIGKPLGDKYLYKINWKTSKKLIPYYTIGAAFGLTTAEFIKYNFF